MLFQRAGERHAFPREVVTPFERASIASNS